MAGFRTFATGEVLTAANVNDFLMGQSVMRFADADARTAALGADVVEGMLTFNLDTDQLEVFDGTNFVVAAPEPPAGIGSNVVSTTKTDTFSASIAPGGESADVTGLTATITPTSATSKILVIASINASCDGGSVAIYTYLFRDGTVSGLRGDASGSRVRISSSSTGNAGRQIHQGIAFLDSPGTTSAVTYSIRLGHQRVIGSNTTVNINQANSDTDSIINGRTASTITAIEVAA